MTIPAPAPPARDPVRWLNNQPYLLLSLTSLFWAEWRVPDAVQCLTRFRFAFGQASLPGQEPAKNAELEKRRQPRVLKREGSIGRRNVEVQNRNAEGREFHGRRRRLWV
jgi:hypothetical protein